MPKVIPGRCSVDVIAQSALEFLSLLDPLQGIFTSGTYIFRGVSSEQFGLLPSAHRSNARLLISEIDIGYGPSEFVHQQCAAEFWTLNKFFTILARQGIRVPENSYLLRGHLDSWRVRFQQPNLHCIAGWTWPSAELYSLIALAQHYGVPTRALDWSWNALTAAYFAAKPALDSTADNEIAVWAVDDFTRQLDGVLDIESERPLRVFSVSGAENDNLRAQRGLFMLSPQHLVDDLVPFQPREYNDVLNDSLAVLKGEASFIRVRVAASEAQRVLALLARAGVTTGALYPGLWGAAREYDDDYAIKSESVGTLSTYSSIGIWDQIRAAAKQVGAV